MTSAYRSRVLEYLSAVVAEVEATMLRRQAIKDAARARFGLGFVAGVSNDYLGYFVTAEAYATPSYVGCGTLYGPAAGERLVRAARELIQELREGLDGLAR